MAVDDYNALALRIDRHILTKTNKNIIDNGFELYFQSIISHLTKLVIWKQSSQTRQGLSCSDR